MSGKIEEQEWAPWMEDGLRRIMEASPDCIVIIALKPVPAKEGKNNFPEVLIGDWNCSTNDIGYMARQIEDIYTVRMLAENSKENEDEEEE